jgi:hypothetical protein
MLGSFEKERAREGSEASADQGPDLRHQIGQNRFEFKGDDCSQEFYVGYVFLLLALNFIERRRRTRFDRTERYALQQEPVAEIPLGVSPASSGRPLHRLWLGVRVRLRLVPRLGDHVLPSFSPS